MSDFTPAHHGVYAHEELSPDGTWRVVYVYVDGERSPTIIEPRVTHVPSGRVVLDMWRSCLNGRVDELTPSGFRLTVSDPYGSTAIVATIDLSAERFVLSDGGSAHPLTQLDATVSSAIERARTEWRAQQRGPALVPALASSWKAMIGIALFVLLALISVGFCANAAGTG